MVWPNLERNPSDGLWICSICVCIPDSLWCDSVLLKSVACVGSTLIYCARGESRLVAYPNGMMWCPFRVLFILTSKPWKINLTAYTDGVHLSHGCITAILTFFFLGSHFAFCFYYFCLHVLSSMVPYLKQI